MQRCLSMAADLRLHPAKPISSQLQRQPQSRSSRRQRRRL
jgi:hypothetical protein